ncbi:Rab family GTPase [Pyrobaculum aerophilum]|uniref:Miro domain-containing protein n=1 Tax=Pyrobaculum aerophilum TaxID=13773 RepID=A0A371R5R0_9CREN|nr:Miro domain-containing protein [Pyrobaculum aerophilum]RFA99422.1 Miro domain-containing protein [Pyrobaculum aerophilum]
MGGGFSVAKTWAVVFLGVGGVGKTTYIYKLLGISKTPQLTRRPRTYFTATELGRLFLVDIPGQRATEVAKAYYEAARSYGLRLDLAVYMYSVVEPETLDALWQIHEWTVRIPVARRILVGNKVDLAEELGVIVEGEDAARGLGVFAVYYTSALKDEPTRLLTILFDNLT